MGARGAVLILVVRTLPDVPSSAVLKLLDRYAKKLDGEGGRLVLAGVHPSLLRILQTSGLYERLGERGVVPAGPELFGPLETAVEDSRAWIADRSSTGPPPTEES